MKGTDGMKGPSSHTEFLPVFEAWEKRQEEVVSWQIPVKAPRGCCRWGISMPMSRTEGGRAVGELGALIRDKNLSFP